MRKKLIFFNFICLSYNNNAKENIESYRSSISEKNFKII